MNYAVKTWRHRKLSRRSRLTVCIVLLTLVIAPVVCALMFSESMMNGITNKYICLSSGHLNLNHKDNSDINVLNEGVYSADKVVTGFAVLYSSSGTSSCQIKGVGKDYFNEIRSSELTFDVLVDGESSLNGIAISLATAKKLNVGLGDKLAMMIVPDSSKSAIRPVMACVTKIFTSGYDQLDSYICFVDYDWGKTLYTEDSSFSTEILVKNGWEERLDEIIYSYGSDYSFTTWDMHNESVYRNFLASREAIFIVLATIITVASLYTASIAQQLIQDDMTDIAVVKLIGGSDRLVKHWAFTTVFAVTLSGIICGTLLGTALGFCLNPALKMIAGFSFIGLSNYLLDFNMTFPFLQIARILVLMLLISAVSIRISLFRTRRIKPIQLFTD